MAEIPTVDQLRKRIDSGVTGEKVGFPDPAAAPLGTDDEASGHPISRRQRELSARQPLYRAPDTSLGWFVYPILLLLAYGWVLGAAMLGAAVS